MSVNHTSLRSNPKTRRGDFAATLDGELRSASNRSLLDSIRTLTAWFVPVLLLFAVVDYQLLPAPQSPEEADVRPIVAGLTVALAVVFAGITIWLRRWPPPLTWANPVTFLIGVCGLFRLVLTCVADPDTDRVLALVAILVGSGCIFFSRVWFAAFAGLAVTAWYTVAYWQHPGATWSSTWFVTLASAVLAYIVLNVRRRMFIEMIAARTLDRRVSDDLSTRVRLGEVLMRTSARFLSLPHDEFNRAVESTLRELGHALGADHAFLCRIDRETLRTAIVYEWVASPVDPRKAALRNLLLSEHDWFFQRLLSGEMTNIAVAGAHQTELTPETALLKRLGADAFLAVPVIQGKKTPWGYFGLAQTSRPTLWSAEEANLLHVVGDILLSTMERHVAETRVRLSEARFRSLFDANIIGVFFGSIYGKISDANGAFFEITGYQAADLPLRWDQLTPSEWRSHDEASILRLLKHGVDHPWEKEFFHKNGSRIPILIGGAVLSHRRGEYVAFVLDLRQRKEDERKIHQLNAALERAARIGTMGEMAAGLAHEVHQPIASIANYANGARKRLDRGRLSDDELNGVFAEVAAQCERAGSVIRNIRDFVRGLHPERRPVDLNVVVMESLKLTRFDVHQREVQIVTDLAADLPPILTDPTQLSQVLLNLVLNAVQAMDDVTGERKLVIRTAVTEDGLVEAYVRDTGHGVAPDDRGRLFDQFFTTKPDGMGLGLPIARSIAEGHGGRLELLHSGPEGSEFVLRLPAIHSETATTKPVASGSEEKR
ncbi:MAG: ATP-binding protein [Planctomycetaceae bacterium]